MRYYTDLNDEQWKIVEARIKTMLGNYGNRAVWSKRELVNAILYLVKTGCQWRLLPNDFPPYSTVHSFYRRARLSGLWQLLMMDLVVLSRRQAGRKDSPTYSLIDSQSTKTVYASEQRSIDGGKKRKAESAIS